jgi:hypothetical protein
VGADVTVWTPHAVIGDPTLERATAGSESEAAVPRVEGVLSALLVSLLSAVLVYEAADGSLRLQARRIPTCKRDGSHQEDVLSFCRIS